MSHHKILVIDDDHSLLYSIRKSLTSSLRTVLLANTGTEGLRIFQQEKPSVVFLDLRLREECGLDILSNIRTINANIPVIMFTAFSTTKTAITASSQGAFDYLIKPVDLSKLKETMERAILSSQANGEKIGQKLIWDEQEDFQIVGSSGVMQEIYKKIGRFARTRSNVLILGESGTGKELVARAIHNHSDRRHQHFVPINCAALTETLLESELFGHEKGAFTGADRRRIGKFEHADGGTLFLDEVGDMSLTTQAKVLRLLQEQKFERLGGNHTIKTDVRIIAATNKDIENMIGNALFRADLYYRLNVFNIKLPCLRHRLEDLPELVNYFVGLFKDDFDKHHVEIDPDVWRILSNYSWPGNMRELQSVIKHALAHSVGHVIRPMHLPTRLLTDSLDRPLSAPPHHSHYSLEEISRQLIVAGVSNVYDQAVELLDLVLIPLALRHTKGNMHQCCEILGISRNTLKSKMRQHGISIKTGVLSKNEDASQKLKDVEI